ncbi:Tudor/PWWP/MBT superfamily protein, putative isoform 1 [Hibiscus syriacus]|uniref:Tudor/PWWP/MBT superfamily protein, putative isoform 1 n=1 Tax=Hibiscus syriacus TaxID=106335 RepID=A0A6A3BS30_HIBSY|nr:uncharacterized protein LOC120212967 [Hibiscus syriacus]KAE8718218.1 Tudor/PWWP/MBT superfamily protein, putative isoform 1 [Hibiscus syriacus]
MVENSSSRKGRRVVEPTTRRKKEEEEVVVAEVAAVDKSEDLIECSGKYCRSCTAGVIADCVALCCCPCALLNLLTLALVKVPWKIGRRCLGFGKKNKKKKKKRNRVEMERKCEKTREIPTVFGEAEKFENDGEGKQEMGNFSARLVEAEKVWLELYEGGHLGFGRVSFTGT